MRWYRKAADQGYLEAINSIGVTYANGNSVTQDNDETLRWFRKAADRDNANGQTKLGDIYNSLKKQNR